MRGWRKMTWAIVLWTGLMAGWAIGGISAVGDLPAATSAEQAGRAIGTGIGMTFLFMIWFVGFVVLAIIWFMSRPKANVTIYGPSNQQVMVSENEARKRVGTHGWTYQPKTAPEPPAPTYWKP